MNHFFEGWGGANWSILEIQSTHIPAGYVCNQKVQAFDLKIEVITRVP